MKRSPRRKATRADNTAVGIFLSVLTFVGFIVGVITLRGFGAR
jgi:hypothetical protein